MSALVRAQPGARASVTTTLVRVESPVFLTAIVKVAVPLKATACESGVFETEIAGLITVTWAESSALTLSPTSGVPVATATLVKLAVLASREQV